MELTYSQHHCPGCGLYFNAAMDAWALPKSRYTHRVVHTAVRLVVEEGLPYRAASWHCGATTACSCRLRRFRTGWRGKRAAEHVTGEYLDEVLADVSGYIAADERYEGPFCVLSLVDNHTFRFVCEVPDDDPTHKDIRRFSGGSSVSSRHAG